MRKQIGMVFQHFNLFPNMSVLENVIEARIRPRPEPRPGGRPGQGAAEPRRSIGKGRCPPQPAFRRPAAGRHRPSTGHESPGAAAGRGDLRARPRTRRRGARGPQELAETTDITMLCVTHEMGFARDVSDRVMMFDKGQIVEEGRRARSSRPLENDRTKSFLSAVLAPDRRVERAPARPPIARSKSGHHRRDLEGAPVAEGSIHPGPPGRRRRTRRPAPHPGPRPDRAQRAPRAGRRGTATGWRPR